VTLLLAKNVNAEAMVTVTASVVALVTVIVKEGTLVSAEMIAQLVADLAVKAKNVLLAAGSVGIVNIDLVNVATKVAGKMTRDLLVNSALALAEEIAAVGIVESVAEIVVEVEIVPIPISCLVVNAKRLPAMPVVKKP
jgi:hypothetical protein